MRNSNINNKIQTIFRGKICDKVPTWGELK